MNFEETMRAEAEEKALVKEPAMYFSAFWINVGLSSVALSLVTGSVLWFLVMFSALVAIRCAIKEAATLIILAKRRP